MIDSLYCNNYNIMTSKAFFRAFLKQLTNHTQPTTYYSNSKTIQSSVGLIFKLDHQFNNHGIADLIKMYETNSKEHEIFLLMTQRSGHERDSNKYNIVFPGGQADQGQSDLVACKRQLYQQIQLDADKQCFYVGRLPKNFYYAKKKGKQVMITCHVWILKDEFQDFTPVLNNAQLIDYRWVPISQMLNPQNIQPYKQKQFLMFQRLALQYPRLGNYLCDNLQMVIMTGLNVSMKRNLWGLTLWIWTYTLMMTLNNINKSTPLNQQLQENRTVVSQGNIFISEMKKLDFIFKPNFLLGKVVSSTGSLWFDKYRVQQFTYPPKQTQHLFKLSALLIVLLIFIYILC